MMSEKKINITNRTIQRNLFRRRLWVIAISLLFFFLYYVGAVSLTFAGMQDNIWKHADILRRSRELFGVDGNGVVMAVTVLLAALSGIEGFSWMDKKQQIVFFESLPVSRARRFWNIVINSFVIFIGSYLVMMLIGFMLAAGWNAMDASIARTAFRYFVQNIFLFLAVYASSVLAVMLTGNILIAILADAVFLGFEPILDMLLQSIRTEMFSTYAAADTKWTHVFSPLTSEIRSISPGKSILLNLIGGAVLLGLAYLVYRKYRKNEDAGKAVLFAPVRWGAKIAVTALFSFFVGILAFSSINNESATGYSIVAMIVTAVIVGGVMEVIYTYNIKSVLKHFPAIPIAAGISILVFCSFRYDFYGYDRWIPDSSKVESAYVFSTNDYTDIYLENGKYVPTSDAFYQKYMHLTDLKAVSAVLKAGEDAYQNAETKEKILNGKIETADLIVGYRMKNGKEERRSISLPITKENKKLMDAVVGTDKFREGYFQIYHDGFVEKNLKGSEISYWNGSELVNPYRVPGEDIYAEFKKAYLKDLQKFNFTVASGDDIIGDLTVSQDISEKRNAENLDYSIEYPVYKEYDNTIAFLKEHGLYQEPMDKSTEAVNLQGPFYIGN